MNFIINYFFHIAVFFGSTVVWGFFIARILVSILGFFFFFLNICKCGATRLTRAIAFGCVQDRIFSAWKESMKAVTVFFLFVEQVLKCGGHKTNKGYGIIM